MLFGGFRDPAQNYFESDGNLFESDGILLEPFWDSQNGQKCSPKASGVSGVPPKTILNLAGNLLNLTGSFSSLFGIPETDRNAHRRLRGFPGSRPKLF